MGRSIKKGPFVSYQLLEKINEMNLAGKKVALKIIKDSLDDYNKQQII